MNKAFNRRKDFVLNEETKAYSNFETAHLNEYDLKQNKTIMSVNSLQSIGWPDPFH